MRHVFIYADFKCEDYSRILRGAIGRAIDLWVKEGLMMDGIFL